MSKQSKPSQLMPLIVLALSWLIPGAGHVCQNRIWRGIIIFVMVGGTFWAGVAMGGIMTVDPQNEQWWFVAEMFTGVHGLIGWHRQQNVYDKNVKALEADEEYEEDFRMLRDRYRGRSSGQFLRDSRALRQDFLDKMLAEDKLALVSPVDTVARAYAGIAGLLNLMCIFDAVLLSLMGITGEPKQQASPDNKQEVAQ